MERLDSVLAFVATTLKRFSEDERGLNTAELLGNAALAIVALVAIWAALQTLGIDVVEWIRGQIFGAG